MRAPETTLPDPLRKYFPEYDAGRLTWEEDRHTILRRLLESGGWDAVTWLRAHASDEELRDFIEDRRGRGIAPRRLRYWGLVLQLPRERVTAWILAQQATPWGRRTAR
jgi:hypothetical protein